MGRGSEMSAHTGAAACSRWCAKWRGQGRGERARGGVYPGAERVPRGCWPVSWGQIGLAQISVAEVDRIPVGRPVAQLAAAAAAQAGDDSGPALPVLL